MEYGLHMPTRGPLSDPDSLITLAQHAEALGFSIITAGDHTVIPRNVESPYPYNRSDVVVGTRAAPKGRGRGRASGTTPETQAHRAGRGVDQ